MAAKRTTKAKRGKRRWVGFTSTSALSRDEVQDSLPEGCRLFDLMFVDGVQKGIYRVQLERHVEALEELRGTGLQSQTSSGKVRLVRERLGLPRPPRKRVR